MILRTSSPFPAVICPAGLWGRCAGGILSTCPEFVLRDGSWGARPDLARIDPEEKPCCFPPLVPGTWPGFCEDPGRYGAGTRVRAALGGRSLLLLIPSGDPLWKSMAEALPGVFLGYRLIAGLTIRGPSGKGRWICIRSSLRRGFCLGPLLEVTSISLLTGRIWSFLRETCVGIPWRKSLGPLWSRGFCV